MKTKALTGLVTVAVAATMLQGVTATADQTVECDGSFPIFDSTALTEEENSARISCVDERRKTIQDRIAERRERKADITAKIKSLKRTRAQVSNRIARDRKALTPLTEVTRLLRYVSGYIAWLNSTSACESGNNPEAHSASGSYHGKLQFSLSTWNSLQTAARYGHDDPHTEPAIVQDAGGVELLKRSGDEQWPTCGD